MRCVLSYTALACALVLSACSGTSQDLRASPRETGTFRVALPQETAARNFAWKASQCFNGGTRASHFYAEHKTVKPGEFSTVEVTQDGLARRVIMAADIVANPEGTEITYFVHSGFSIFVTFRPILEGWAIGRDTGCGSLFG